MKKVIFIALIAVLLSACGKDEPVLDIKPGPVPETGTPDKPGGKDEVENKDTTPPTEMDLKAYFDINSELNVSESLQRIKASTEEKEIQGRKIQVNESNVLERNDEEGSFVCSVSGTVNGKEFTVEFACKGLKKRPGKYFMATRVQVSWKKEVASIEKTSIAFDELYRLKKSDQFTAAYLSQWVTFSSTNPEGADSYVFTDEDIAKTEITEVQFIDNYITFVLSYDGTKGKTSMKERPSLRFNKNEYYKDKVTLTNDPKNYYAQGVYEYLSSFYGSFIETQDDKVFFVELVSDSKNIDRTDNTVSCTLSLSTFADSNNELARFEYSFSGFKPLSDLKNEWKLSSKAELENYMSSRLKKAPEGDVLQILKRYPVSNWIKLAKMEVDRKGQLLELYCDKAMQNNISVDAWIPISRKVIHSDILLIAPHFEVVAAKKKADVLTVTVAMTYVNEVSLKDVQSTFDIIL